MEGVISPKQSEATAYQKKERHLAFPMGNDIMSKMVKVRISGEVTVGFENVTFMPEETYTRLHEELHWSETTVAAKNNIVAQFVELPENVEYDTLLIEEFQIIPDKG